MVAHAGTPGASAVEMNQLVLPIHTNALGTIFGGQVMAWIDVCAAMAAMRHARNQVVTASMDALDFIAPIHLGDLVNLKAMVNYVGRTSLEVGVRVEAEDPRTGERSHAASAYLTFVSIDPAGHPVAVRPIAVSTPIERLRYDEAQARRRERLALSEARRRLREAHAARHPDVDDA